MQAIERCGDFLIFENLESSFSWLVTMIEKLLSILWMFFICFHLCHHILLIISFSSRTLCSFDVIVHPPPYFFVIIYLFFCYYYLFCYYLFLWLISSFNLGKVSYFPGSSFLSCIWTHLFSKFNFLQDDFWRLSMVFIEERQQECFRLTKQLIPLELSWKA